MGKERTSPNERPLDDKARLERSGLKEDQKAQGLKPDVIAERDHSDPNEHDDGEEESIEENDSEENDSEE